MGKLSLDFYFIVLYTDVLLCGLKRFLERFVLLRCLLALRRGQLPDNLENLLRVIRSDGGSGLLALEHNLNELALLLAVDIEGKPVVEVLATYPPPVRHSLRGLHEEVLDVGPEDGLGGREWEVVLADDDGVTVDDHLTVLVQRLHCQCL
jgi:hypothetical protein